MDEVEKIAKDYEQFHKKMLAMFLNEEADKMVDQMRNRLSSLYTFFNNNQFVGSGKEVANVLYSIGRLLNGPFAIEVQTTGTGAPTNASFALGTAPGATAQRSVQTQPSATAAAAISKEVDMPVNVAKTTPNMPPVAFVYVVEKVPYTNDFTDELSEVTSAGSGAKFFPDGASGDIVLLENKLINAGVSDIDRQKVIETAMDVEDSLLGTGKTLKDILASTKSITGSAVTAFKNSVGTPKNYWSLFNTNLKAVANLQTKESLISDYANIFSETLQSTDSVMSKAASDSDINPAAIFSEYAITGNIPKKIKNEVALSKLSKEFTAITEPTLAEIDAVHSVIYGDNITKNVVSSEQRTNDSDNTSTILRNVQVENTEVPVNDVNESTDNNAISMPDGTKVVRVGDFYEAYGEDARSLSNKLNLKITQKVINGEKVDMVGFPASSLENYKNVINNNISYTNNQNITKSSGKTKVVKAKKKDWVSHDVYWYAPKGKTVVAYSTTSAKDLIDAMSEDNPTMTINDLHNAINYDEEAKKVLSAYINSGFGEEVASKYFGDNAKKYETVTNLAEIYSAGIEKADGGNQVPNDNDVTPQRTPETSTKSSSATDSTLQKVEYIEKNAPNLTNECELIATKHTKTGDNIWVVTLKNRLSADDFKDLNSRIKEVGGYYSIFGKTPEGKALPGFVFNAEPSYDGIKTFNDFFDSAKTQKAAETNTIEHADETAADVQNDIPQLQKNYEKAVEEVAADDEATARAKLENRTAIQVTEHTPDVILEYVKNSEDLPIIMNYSKLYLAVRKDGVVKGHYHNLGPDIAKKLPEMLSRPDVILMLPNGRLNILTDIQTDKGKNGIIAIELNSVKDIERAYKKYNVVVTMFSSKDNYVKNLIGNGNNDIVYKREDLSQVNPQLYEWLAIVNDKSSLNNNVAQEGVFVKKNDDLLNNQQNDDILKEKETMEDIVDVEQKSEVLAGESVSDDRGLRSTAKTTTAKRTETDSGEFLQENVRAKPKTTKSGSINNEITSTNNKQTDISKKALNDVADFVIGELARGTKITSNTLFDIAKQAYGGSMADGVFTPKDAYDAMELGVNKYILSMENVSAEKMLEILELLPTQTKRTEDMIKFQQFSTPPSIAYLANYAANINSNDIMLEPSAGIGGIAIFAKRDGATVYVNEIDPRRLNIVKELPFDGFYNENAEQLDNILGDEIEPTVIVMNPPFSSSSERNIKNTKIGAKHIEQALKILAPNGRLVAIVGHGMSDGAPAFRNWWKDIKSQYNVRANIRINGKNYNKYGTNFDIQMLVIDKNGITTHTETGYVDTLQELQDKLGGIRDGRPTIDYSTNEQRTHRYTRKEVIATGETANVRNGVVSDASSLANKGKSTNMRGIERKSATQDIHSTNAEHREPTSITSENTNVVVSENGRVGSRQSDRFVGEENTTRTDNGDSRQSDIQTGRTKSRTRVKHKELTDSIFEQYQTQPLRVKNAQPHPAKVSESAAMSAIEPPPITYKPNIPQNLIDNGVVSAVQLEAISYAGQSHAQTLPNGNTRGFFLGDGTGIGKGRTIAGMILDNYNHGRKKALWVTLNTSLVNDAKRDVKALFGNSDLVTQFVGGNKADSVLSTDEAIMVISYNALSKGFDNNNSNFEKIVKWLGKDFDGLIVFDEAHKMGNATATKGTRGVKKASQTGLAGIALQEALPKAKIVYSSATGATEVENLRYAERLGLWGEGTAFVTGDDFVSKIKAGGLAAMELIARDMKAMGVYLSRNISYEDVRYDKITHKLTSQQKKIYDELARSWQIVLNNIHKALDTTNQSKDGTARGRALGAFWSSQQRFFNQILTSMQVPSVIADIEKQLADGKSCVIQLVSTNEAAQNEEFARLKAEELELDEFDLTPKQMLMSYIENSFPVQQFE